MTLNPIWDKSCSTAVQRNSAFCGERNCSVGQITPILLVDVDIEEVNFDFRVE
jgi:hypothetical protein